VTPPTRSGRGSRPERCGDAGVAAVEFALVLPILVMLLFVAITAGTIAVGQLAVNSAARDAARVGAVTSEGACILALERLEGTTATAGTATCTEIGLCPGTESVIRVDTQRSVSLPFLGDRTFEMSSTARYRCEI
jgi:Flp pilus assembly protein TadG